MFAPVNGAAVSARNFKADAIISSGFGNRESLNHTAASSDALPP
jgi:hypothetical protein